MEFFSGLDVSIDETAICVVDDKGKVHLQTAVATDPEAIVQVLKPFLPKLRHVGHEAGSLSPWLHPELAALGLPAPRGHAGSPGIPAAEDVLRELGERNDIIKRIHRGLTEKGWERGVEGFCEQRGEDDPSHSRQGCEDLHVMLLRLPRSGLFRRNEPGGQGIELAMRLLELLVRRLQ